MTSVDTSAAAGTEAESLVIDLDSLTVLDVMDLEEELGIPIAQMQDILQDSATPSGRIMGAFVWVMARRTNPGITLREAAAGVRLAALTSRAAADAEAGADGDAGDPKGPGGASTGSASPDYPPR